MSALPFDKIAEDYDTQFTSTRTGRLQRQRVYHFLAPLLGKENIQTVLEFNCGTGEDALWLAEKGCTVLATDNSKEMIQVAQKKAKNNSNKKMQVPDFQVVALENLSTISNEKKFDLIFSNFGGLNCLSPQQFQNWANEITSLLTTNGFVVAVVLGRFCALESLYFLLKRNWSAAWRRLNKNAIDAPLGDNVSIPIWYYSPKMLTNFFSKEFKVIKIRPIGCALPPSYLDPFFMKRPFWLSILNKMENRFGNQKIWANLSDHYLIVLQKK